MVTYVKELAMTLRRLDLTWGAKAYIHCMTYALNDLSMSDMRLLLEAVSADKKAARFRL